ARNAINIFASLGAEVLGIDVDSECIAICRKCKRYFEARLGRVLKMEFLQANFRAFDPDSTGQRYDAPFSMSALAHIRPLKEGYCREDFGSSERYWAGFPVGPRIPTISFLDVLTGRRLKRSRSSLVGTALQLSFSPERASIPRHFCRSDALLRVTSKLN